MADSPRSEEHTSELQSHDNLGCRLLLEKKKQLQIKDNGQRSGAAGGRGQRVQPHHPPSHTTSSQPSPLLSFHPSTTRSSFFFFNDTATPEIYTLSLHDALSISPTSRSSAGGSRCCSSGSCASGAAS